MQTLTCKYPKALQIQMFASWRSTTSVIREKQLLSPFPALTTVMAAYPAACIVSSQL